MLHGHSTYFVFRFTQGRMRLECLLNVPANYCPEIQIDGEDYKVFERVWNEVRELKYLTMY